MFLDTSGLLCLLHRDEFAHQVARELFSARPVRLVHSYVLAELVPLAARRGIRRELCLEFAIRISQNPDVETIYVDRDLHDEAMDLLAKRLDKTYSLCDAVSFVLMRRRGIQESLTSDHHFEQEGFVALLRTPA